MAKLITKKTTTTITEEVEIVPAASGEEINHRYMKVGGYGTYRGEDGQDESKPQMTGKRSRLRLLRFRQHFGWQNRRRPYPPHTDRPSTYTA